MTSPSGARWSITSRRTSRSSVPVPRHDARSPAARSCSTCSYDAAVVGSALVSVIAEGGRRPDLITRVEHYVQWLRGASALNAHA